MIEGDLDRGLTAIAGMDGSALRARWVLVTRRAVPQVSPALLRLALAWELQAAQSGGLPRRLTQQLDQLAAGKTRTRQARPGMRLAREWNGTVQVVTILEDGTIRWNERDWRSLSEVARAITGTRWSGPAFLGLKQKRAAA